MNMFALILAQYFFKNIAGQHGFEKNYFSLELFLFFRML
jgi:hypothetical protein